MKQSKKLEKLHALAKEIETCLKCYHNFKNMRDEDRFWIRNLYLKGPWFFPPDESGVKGFLGTSDVMFVCPRPSTSSFDDQYSMKFYSLLKKHGFQNAHLTDMIKCRSKAKPKALPAEEISNCATFLDREYRILQPRRIAAMGNIVYQELVDRYPNVTGVIHYSYAVRYNKIEKLDKQLEHLACLLEKD